MNLTVAMLLIPGLLQAGQEASAQRNDPKAVLVELRRALSQRLPVEIRIHAKVYMQADQSAELRVGLSSATDTRLTLTADSFLLELFRGEPYEGVHHFDQCTLTVYSMPRRTVSSWQFQEDACTGWPRYCPADCEYLWQNQPFGGLFSPVVAGSVSLGSKGKDQILQLTTLTRRSTDNGRNPIVGEQTTEWSIRYSPLSEEGLARLRSWKAPKGARRRTGAQSAIIAEKEAADARPVR
jgi:hypothetical protein